jgi:hypothetical protein
LCGFVAGKIDLYDLVTMQDQYQEHDAIEILKVVLALGGHGEPACCRNLSYHTTTDSNV